MKSRIIHVVAFFVACVGMQVPALAGRPATDQSAAVPTYLNTGLSPEVRAKDLVNRMTLEEKASQLVNGARAIPTQGSRLQLVE